MVDLSFLSCTTPNLRKACHTCFGLFLESCDSMADFLDFLIRMFTSFLSAQYFSQADVALVFLNLRNSCCNFFMESLSQETFGLVTLIVLKEAILLNSLIIY